MRIVISKDLARKCGSEGAALNMLGLAERVNPGTGEVLKTPRKDKRRKKRK